MNVVVGQSGGPTVAIKAGASTFFYPLQVILKYSYKSHCKKYDLWYNMRERKINRGARYETEKV